MASHPPEIAGVAAPWERQEGESPQHWAMFQTYRDLGPTRSLRAVASDMGKSVTQIQKVSVQKRWVARVDAYDREQDRIARVAQIDKAIRMGERHAEEAVDLAKAILVYPRALLRKLEKDPTAAEALEKEDVPALMAMTLAASKAWPLIAQAERVARGYSNEAPPMPVSDDPDVRREAPVDFQARLEGVAEVLEEAGKLPPGFAQMLRDGGQAA